MISYRKRLLASTVTTILGGVGMLAFAQPASAQCVSATTTTALDTRTCATTVTTNTTGNGAVDRNGQYDTSGIPTFLIV